MPPRSSAEAAVEATSPTLLTPGRTPEPLQRPQWSGSYWYPYRRPARENIQIIDGLLFHLDGSRTITDHIPKQFSVDDINHNYVSSFRRSVRRQFPFDWAEAFS